MKIADNAAVPREARCCPPLQTANGEVGDDGDASCVPTTPLESEARGADAEDVADDESSEISSSGNGSDGDEMPAAQNDIPGPVWRNRRSHVVHRCSQSARSTACGRLVSSSNFELLEEGSSTTVSMANFWSWVFLLGPAPFAVCFASLLAKRISGWGICVSPFVGFCLCFLFFICC